MKLRLLFIALFLSIGFFSFNVANAAQAHPPGTLVSSGGAVWRINETSTGRQAFDSLEKFLSHRYSFSNVVPANSADLALSDQGFMPWGDGVLFNDSGTIYLVSGGVKRGFASFAAFQNAGFRLSRVVNGNLSSLQAGSVLNEYEQNIPGTFVNSAGTVSLVTNMGNKGVPSAAVLFSYGAMFEDVVPSKGAQILVYAGILPYRSGTLLNDAGTLWAVNVTEKRAFPSAACFTNFGFGFDMAIVGSSAGLTSQGSICADIPAFVSSYERKAVVTSRGTFTASIMAFNLASGRVRAITDTAADNECSNNCPVASLAAYASANAATSAINGTYFCPPEYTECAGKTNTFFWKVYDSKVGRVINHSNGLGENDPFVAFGTNGEVKYFSRYSQWNIATFPIVGGINHAPALIEGGNNILDVNKLDEKQRTVKSNRSALGFKGQVVYAVVVSGANVPDAAAVMQALGVDYAINLDGGGSSAMFYQGAYKVGPGRNLPNAIVFQEY